MERLKKQKGQGKSNLPFLLKYEYEEEECKVLRRFVQAIDVRLVLIYLAEMLGILGLIFIMPLIISLIFREFTYSLIFFTLSVLLLIVGYFARRLQNLTRKRPILRDALIVTALIYLLYSLIGGLVFLPEKSYINGVFEVMSGFTTTGLTMFVPEVLPRTLVFFRSYTQWLGGLGIIIVSLALFIRPGAAPLKLYNSEYGEDNIIGSVVSTARAVIKIYLVLTACGYISFLLAGMNYFDSLVHIMSGISTGGFSAYTGSIGYYNSALISMTVCLFMFLGSVSFPLYYKVTKGGIKTFFKDIQVRALFIIILLASALFFLSFGFYFKNLAPAIFQAITSISQTGFNTVDIAALSDRNKFIMVLLMIVGGSTYSTTGGIKLLRFIVLLSALRWLVWKKALPEESKISLKIDKVEITPNNLSIIMGFVTAYMLILFFSTLFIMYLENFNFIDSLFEVASAEGTVGLSTGITSPDMNIFSKILLIFNMWVGRLEIVPVLILLSPRTWLKGFKRNSVNNF